MSLTTRREFNEAVLTILKYRKEQLELDFEKAQKEATTDMPKTLWPVHIGHCCFKHGCKYGYENCPVALGVVKQKYECEYCRDEKNDPFIYVEKPFILDKKSIAEDFLNEFIRGFDYYFKFESEPVTKETFAFNVGILAGKNGIVIDDYLEKLDFALYQKIPTEYRCKMWWDDLTDEQVENFKKELNKETLTFEDKLYVFTKPRIA